MASIAVIAVVGILGCVRMQSVENEVQIITTGNEIPPYIKNMWVNWKAKYNKEYEGYEEEVYRLRVFYDNVKELQEWARGPKQTYKLAINKFVDLTSEEFTALYTTSKYTSSQERNEVSLLTTDVPDFKDWRDEGAVTKVKNQEACGSCWAFSAIAAMEGLHFQQSGRLQSFSEQQLVDCSSKYGNNGCNGGLMDKAFQYLEENKVELEDDYKYTAKTGKTCRASEYTGVFSNKGFYDIPKDDSEQLKAAVSKHVVSVAIEADQLFFKYYASGVLDTSSCGQHLDHGVTAVGYGNDKYSGKPYWLVKNSWGADWGEKGYIRMARNVTYPGGQCGILLSASYPT